mgnify:CR=1 FL=1
MNGQPSLPRAFDYAAPAITSIVEGRDPVPSFRDGASAQAVADAVLASDAEGRWVDVSRALD